MMTLSEGDQLSVQTELVTVDAVMWSGLLRQAGERQSETHWHGTAGPAMSVTDSHALSPAAAAAAGLLLSVLMVRRRRVELASRSSD